MAPGRGPIALIEAGRADRGRLPLCSRCSRGPLGGIAGILWRIGEGVAADAGIGRVDGAGRIEGVGPVGAGRRRISGGFILGRSGRSPGFWFSFFFIIYLFLLMFI